MKNILIPIILFAICAALVVGVIIPVANQIKDTGQKTFTATKNMNNNIKEN